MLRRDGARYPIVENNKRTTETTLLSYPLSYAMVCNVCFCCPFVVSGYWAFFVQPTTSERWLILDLNKRCYLDVFVEALASVQVLVYQFDDEIAVNLFGLKLLNQVAGRFHRATRSEEVVVQQDDVVLVDGILMNFDGVDAILFSVAFLDGFARQLAWFATEHNASAQFESQC